VSDERSGGPDAQPGRMSDEEYRRALTERNSAARARGLPTPYIPGGEDPDPQAAAAEERRLGRLLLIMVLLIVVGGFAVSIVGLILVSNR
jgi:hypothetical protein